MKLGWELAGESLRSYDDNVINTLWIYVFLVAINLYKTNQQIFIYIGPPWQSPTALFIPKYCSY